MGRGYRALAKWANAAAGSNRKAVFYWCGQAPGNILPKIRCAPGIFRVVPGRGNYSPKPGEIRDGIALLRAASVAIGLTLNCIRIHLEAGHYLHMTAAPPRPS